jgi:hypothetical protein
MITSSIKKQQYTKGSVSHSVEVCVPGDGTSGTTMTYYQWDNENTHESVWARYVPLAQKRRIRGHFMPKRQRIKILLGANSKENLFFFDE